MAEQRLEEMRAARLAKRQALLDTAQAPYPAEARRTHTLAQIHEQFEQLQTGEADLTVVGRITSLRRHGGVAFLDLADATGSLQLQVSRDHLAPEIFDRLETLDSGDFIEAAGQAILTNRGVETLLLTEFHLLSKSIRPLPSTWYGLKDQETRFRQREVDLLLNPEAKQILLKRSHILTWLRDFLLSRNFLEVQTPILQPIAGGAAAEPFMTHHNALDATLYLRIAPEIYLKRLIIAGYEKVFEVSTNFRNEGIDRQHNPEFTSIELYWAYADYEDLMDLTEEMFVNLVTTLNGSTELTWQGTSLSFEGPFKRLRYVDIVSERLGVNILEEKDPQVYLEIFKKEGLAIPTAHSYNKLVDELYKELIRPTLIQPTLLYDYPFEMVPLAKRNATDPRVAEKFQLLVHGMELTNAYTELNDPVEQRQRFEEQQAAYDAGDREAHQIDEEYLRAMEYGMPPTAGWAVGVDRLTTLLTDTASIRDTIAFPLLRPEL